MIIGTFSASLEITNLPAGAFGASRIIFEAIEMNEDRKKRRGRTPLEDPRTHCVSVRLNDEELDELDSKRGKMARGEWMRCAGFDRLPHIIPAENIEKWQALARTAANINQIAKVCNSRSESKSVITEEEFNGIREVLNKFRASLIGE